MLCVLCQGCGAFTIVCYAATIFRETGAEMDPSLSGIILGVVQIFGTYISAILVDNVGRRPLLIISCIGSILGLSSVGFFAYFKATGMDLSAVEWIPVVSLSFVIFISNIGLVCLPFVMMTELLSNKLRTIGCSAGMITLSVMAYIFLQTMPVLIEYIHIYGIMAVFTGICVFGLGFIYFIVPETKGKVLTQV